MGRLTRAWNICATARLMTTQLHSSYAKKRNDVKSNVLSRARWHAAGVYSTSQGRSTAAAFVLRCPLRPALLLATLAAGFTVIYGYLGC